MRLLAAVTVLTVALLGGASVSLGASIGANDDSAKHAADDGAALYGEMAATGLRQTVIAVRFEPSNPLQIRDKPLLDRVIPTAIASGLRVVLAVYPYPPREIEAGLGSPSLFGSYVGTLASIYPQVRQFVIGNEPNQPAFWRPQFDPADANVSAASFGPYLAAAFDVLESIDPEIAVVGVGLSPRGNDRPDAKNNISTSPVRFLRALGAWYRKSGRTRPLMDAFSFHPYPNRATDPLERGYAWPNAGFVNLDRIKQALWDAFDGTAQPTTLNGLSLHLDEVGWQVDTSGRAGYQGHENTPVTDELTQAAIYGQLIRQAACDPDIEEVSFFGFRDDGLRSGFQAALQRADGAPRPAAAVVRDAIAATAGGCAGPEAHWEPSADVVGAQVMAVDALASDVTTRIATGEDARATVCVRSLGLWHVIPSRTQCRTAAIAGLRPANIAVPTALGARARVEVVVQLEAAANKARRTLVVQQAQLKRT